LGGLLVFGCDAGEQRPPVPARARPVADVPLPPDYVAFPRVVPEEAEAGPARIVSTAPQLTETACALGLREQLVGRSSFCDYPPGVEAVASVGALLDINVEMIASLEPDLVLVSGRSRMITERLENVGLRFVSLPDTSLDDVFAAITQLGRLCGRTRTAELLVSNLRADLQRLCAADRSPHSHSVLIHVGEMRNPPGAPWVAGPGSYLGELLVMLGHENAAVGLKRPFGQLPLEEVLAVDPEVILELRGAPVGEEGQQASALAAWAAVGPLKAVRNGDVRVLPGREHHIPGPRVGITLHAMMTAIPR
jgi:iron complex transport system substrate-binding protein